MPRHGLTLREAVGQVENSGETRPRRAVGDRAYRGHGRGGTAVVLCGCGRDSRLIHFPLRTPVADLPRLPRRATAARHATPASSTRRGAEDRSPGPGRDPGAGRPGQPGPIGVQGVPRARSRLQAAAA